MGGKKYSVGKMAELCNIPPKQLRYFDDKKIITPSVRDGKNNYRYYSESQIDEILLVKEMRQLGIPLKKISYLLNNRNLTVLYQELYGWLHNARENVSLALERYDKTLELLLRLLSVRELIDANVKSSDVISNSFSIVEVKARNIVSTRYCGLYSAEDIFIGRRAELYGIAEKYSLETEGANMAIFYNRGYLAQFNELRKDCLIDLEVFMTVKKPNLDCPNCRLQKSFYAVSGIHVGHYRNMKPVYQAMESWAVGQGLRLSGDAVEEYIAGTTHTDSESNYVTRLLLTLHGSEI
jgi:DNA-binding transcriptional MerR regulator